MNSIRISVFLIACIFGFNKVYCRQAQDGPLYKEKPNWLKQCKRNDPNLSKCLNDMFFLMFPELAKGIPEVNIAPFEPLYLDKVSVSKGSGPITLSGSFLNLTVMGPSNATPTFTELEIAKRKMHSGIYLPLLDIKAQYNLKGKILVLPLVGHGGCELKLFKVDTKVESDISFPKVKGEEILRIDKMRVTFRVGGMKINLHNLFNGNKVLGQTLNAFLNQNADEIINELRDSIGESLGEIFKDLMNEIFSKMPTKFWLLEDDQELQSQQSNENLNNSNEKSATENISHKDNSRLLIEDSIAAS